MGSGEALKHDALQIIAAVRRHLQLLQLQGMRRIPFAAQKQPALVTSSHDLSGSAQRRPCQNKHAALQAIREDMCDCLRCKLSASRKNLVFGVGNPDAQLMFVGEGPGADEDIQGEPFVGKAGQLLTRIIKAINLERSDVYIANIVKCRPPGNRDPQDDEIQTCIPFLKQQIEVIQPRIICTLGRVASKSLLNTEESITSLRGRFHMLYNTIRVMPTYHPSFLLRYPEKKRETWEDMQKVQKEYFDSAD